MNKEDESGMTVAIIPAAGSGIRMKSDKAKQFLSFDGKPLLAVTLQSFQNTNIIDAVIVVVPGKDVDYCTRKIVERYGFNKVVKVIEGGKRRQDSVRMGLEATEGKYDFVLIHDGVRPLIEEELIERVATAAKEHGAAIAGLPAKETVKEVNETGEVVRTYDRGHVWLIQTPQGFRYEDILKAHRKALSENWAEATDDSVLIEKIGIVVKIVEGSEENIKVTTPNDLDLIKLLQDKRQNCSPSGE